MPSGAVRLSTGFLGLFGLAMDGLVFSEPSTDDSEGRGGDGVAAAADFCARGTSQICGGGAESACGGGLRR